MVRLWHELRPPRVLLDNDVRWVLLAAFAGEYPEGAGPDSPQRATELVKAFRLVNEVTSGRGTRELAAALTPVGQAELSEMARSRIMRSLAVAQARDLVCEAAEAAAVDIVLLKQAALEVLGVVKPAQRYASDVDALVAPRDIETLSIALTSMGCAKRPRRNPKYHPLVLRTSADISIEMHTEIPYVRDTVRGEPLNLTRLQSHEWLSSVNSQKFEHVFVPHRSVLAAHLVVHSLEQHRFTPRHHPAFRAIVDAWWLRLDSDTDLAQQAYTLIATDVAREEYEGLLDLVRALRAGNIDALPRDSGRLLEHAIASSIDERYRSRILFQRELQVMDEAGFIGWTKLRAGQAFKPTEEELSWVVRSGAARDETVARRVTPLLFAKRVGTAIGGWIGRKI